MSVVCKNWDNQRRVKDQKSALKRINRRKVGSDNHIDHSTPPVWSHLIQQSKKKQLRRDETRRIASLNMNTYHQIHNAKHKLDCGPTYSGHMVRVYHHNRVAKMHELERLAFENVHKCRQGVQRAKAHEVHSRALLDQDFQAHMRWRESKKSTPLVLRVPRRPPARRLGGGGGERHVPHPRRYSAANSAGVPASDSNSRSAYFSPGHSSIVDSLNHSARAVSAVRSLPSICSNVDI